MKKKVKKSEKKVVSKELGTEKANIVQRQETVSFTGGLLYNLANPMYTIQILKFLIQPPTNMSSNTSMTSSTLAKLSEADLMRDSGTSEIEHILNSKTLGIIKLRVCILSSFSFFLRV